MKHDVPLNLDEDSEDLTDADVSRAVQTTSSVEFIEKISAEGMPLHYALRRRKPYFYGLVTFNSDKVLVFRLDWLVPI